MDKFEPKRNDTKICRYCQSEISKKASVCCYCSRKQTNPLSYALVLLAVGVVIGLFYKGGSGILDKGNSVSPTPYPTKTPSKATSTPAPTPTKSASNEFSSGLGEYSSGDYLYATAEDLEKYHANMEGVKICIVTDIDDIDDEKIQSTICKGYMMSNFNTRKSYSGVLKKGDIVVIIGEVSGYDVWGSAGKSITFKNCLVVAAWDDAEKYKKDSSDEKLEKYFYASADMIASGVEVSEEEFKNLCEYLDYEDILRNSKNNKGKLCKVSGNVDQIIEGFFGTYTIYIVDGDKNKWECTYTYKDEESHLLENDSVTFYGECDGTTTAKTVLGKQVTMPDIEVKYIEMN